jgi:glucose-1-phosphate cytidylyltransferase
MTVTQAVILAGGLGTRMREESEFRPKPMTLIGGRPILDHLISYLAKFEFTEIVILLGYRGDVIRDHYLNFRARNNPFSIDLQTGKIDILEESSQTPKCKLTFVDTGEKSLTGERLVRAKEYLQETFLLTYGDGLSDINLFELKKFHASHSEPITVSASRNPSRFGVLELEESGNVRKFSEKPDRHDLINMGFFIIDKSQIDNIPRNTMLETDFMRNAVASGELNAYRHEGFFLAIDTSRDLEIANALFNEGKAPWII